MSTPSSDEMVGHIALGLEDVVTKVFGGQVQYTLLIHGTGVGVMCATNATPEDSLAALNMAVERNKPRPSTTND